MAKDVQYEMAKKNILKRLRKIVANCDEVRTDIQWWNECRLDETPIDAGADIALAALARHMIATVEADQPITKEMLDRFNQQVMARAKA